MDLVACQTAMASNLFRQQRNGGNVIISPISIYCSLAAVFAGARHETARQIADLLCWPTDATTLVNRLKQSVFQLKSASGPASTIANSMWLDAKYAFLPEFLAEVGDDWATAELADFQNEPERARQVINRWVAQATGNHLDELLEPGTIDHLSRLVLANAVYFTARWHLPFEPLVTTIEPFRRLDDSKVAVPTMHQTEHLWYYQGPGCVAVDLLYVGGETSMLVLLPDEGSFASLAEGFDHRFLATIADNLVSRYVNLSLPRFKVEQRLQLKSTLMAMGMTSVFGEDADLSGIDGTRDLYLADVLHQTFVDVDEHGTKAAAATAAVIPWQSIPPPSVDVRVDRPFFFVIRHRQTQTALFIGRVENPS